MADNDIALFRHFAQKVNAQALSQIVYPHRLNLLCAVSDIWQTVSNIF
jgi:hypothetical protein